MSETQAPPLDTWAVVEIMGHSKVAGKISEETHFAQVLLRVDVPKTSRREAYTTFLGGSSIFRLTPVTEALGMHAAEEIERWHNPLPVDMPTAPKLIPATTAPHPDDVVEDDDDDEDIEPEDYDKYNEGGAGFFPD